MGWRFVRQPGGRLARFSEVVDDFTHCDMTEDEALDLCRREHGMDEAAARHKVGSALADLPYTRPQLADGAMSGYSEVVPWRYHEPMWDGLDRFRDSIGVIACVHGRRAARARERQLSRDAGGIEDDAAPEGEGGETR